MSLDKYEKFYNVWDRKRHWRSYVRAYLEMCRFHVYEYVEYVLRERNKSDNVFMGFFASSNAISKSFDSRKNYIIASDKKRIFLKCFLF